MRIFILVLAMAFGLAACTEGFVSFPVTSSAQKDVPDDVEIIRLDETNITSFARPSRRHVQSNIPSGNGWNYRVGVGDIISVIVFDHPELTLPAGPQRTAEESGFRVQADGTFFFPYVGQVMAEGRTLEDIRGELTGRLATYIPDPQLEVRVAAFNSQKVVVSGEVKKPNRQPLTTTPLTLAAAVSEAGGLTERGDAREITIQRGNRRYRVDMAGFLNEGMRRNNPTLQDGDVINVPRRQAQEAFLLGQIKKPDVIDLSQDTVTLTQAISRLGGLDEIRADARGIFVFRKRHPGITVFQLDTSSPTGMLLGTQFVLEPGDVVYVVRSPLMRWNDTISALLPSVRAVDLVDSVAN
ncbi:MAG: polysaccharide biosynthesis/export family protein [Sediminimonas sp.]|uniref:polysaccharide biosynthesis/export family protein n=1 Tax=Sediminimonas sp. TaxID=2823379 RepID=UPI00286FAFEB|nr:polysaccharide biosynthesis/export family protein [Sediminimonas sp.]MDR9483753.1 polysaccharide biosynthesis/export family protein [Sediminimonas sp.]